MTDDLLPYEKRAMQGKNWDDCEEEDETVGSERREGQDTGK